MMKHKRLKRFFAFLAVILCLMCCVVPVFAFDAIDYDAVEEPDVEYVRRSPVPATIKYETSHEGDPVKQTIFDISHDFLVGRKLVEDTYDYFRFQSGAQTSVLNIYTGNGGTNASLSGYRTLLNMHEDQVESRYGSYSYDNVQHSLFLDGLNLQFADLEDPYPVIISGGDFYIENLTKDGNLFYFYLHISVDAFPDFDRMPIDIYVKANKYGSEFSDEFRFSYPGLLDYDNPDMPNLVFGVPLDRLGYKWDDETGQFVDKINGKPFEGLYISEYEISIQSPGMTLPTESEFSLYKGTYRIDLFHALQPDTYIMRDKDLDAKLTVADDINFHIDFIADAIGGFFDLQLFPGFSLGGLLLIILAFSMVMWFLRVFGGG